MINEKTMNHKTYKVMDSKTRLMITGKSFNNLEAAQIAKNRCKIDTYIDCINW